MITSIIIGHAGGLKTRMREPWQTFAARKSP